MSRNNKPTIHKLHLVDRSGSMAGERYVGAIEGLNEELNVLKGDPTANYTFSVIEFDSDYTGARYETHSWLTPVKDVPVIVGKGANGGTPLYEATGLTLERILKSVKPGEAVILTISTDGGENQSKGVYAAPGALKHTISLCERLGYVVTFMGAKVDVDRVINEVGIKANNTLSRTNSGAGIKGSYKMSADSTTYYAQELSRGISVDSLVGNFFSKTVENPTNVTPTEKEA